MDGRSQVLEDEWRHQLAGFIHTHFTGFVYISTLKNETPRLPNVSQTPPYRAGLLLNIKQGMVDKTWRNDWGSDTQEATDSQR